VRSAGKMSIRRGTGICRRAFGIRLHLPSSY
jgi:hypothetical protein